MKIERAKLAELVFNLPLSKLAPRFGISDRGLAKVCERYAIPVPPAGHWWKLTEQNIRFAARIRPSAATPYHGTIMAMVAECRPTAEILEKIRPLGYSGAGSSLNQYIARHLHGKARHVQTGNRFSKFVVRVPSSPKPYQAERPELPPGPTWCFIGERHRDGDDPEKAVEASSLLDAIAPELAYAKEHDEQLYVAFWFEVGTNLPSGAYTALTWDMVTGQDEWTISGRLGVNPRKKERRIITVQLVERARHALQELRKSSGRVITSPSKTRTLLSNILGPSWKRHAAAIRKELGTPCGESETGR